MGGKIFIGGGTGLIGRHLSRVLTDNGYNVTILSRSIEKAKKEFKQLPSINFLKWTGKEDTVSFSQNFENAVCVVNLAGAPVAGKRWTDEYKKVLYDSRIDTTRHLVDSIKKCRQKPECFICSVGAGIYGFRDDEKLDETASLGNDFLARLCIDWEREAFKAEEAGIRTITMRTSIVLDDKEGALPELMTPFKFYAGGYFGSGSQYLSWIHINDLSDMYEFVLENTNVQGPVNASAPHPVTNKEFCKILGSVIHKPCWAKVPAFALKIAVGEFAETLLTGQRVIPAKTVDNGFKFKFPFLKESLQNLLGR